MTRRTLGICGLAALTLLLLAGRGQHLAATAGPLPLTGLTFAGQVNIRDIDHGTPSLGSDRLQFALVDAPAPPAGRSLNCYLGTDTGRLDPCGALLVSGGVVDQSLAFPGRNLIGSYRGVRLVQEALIFSATLPPGALAQVRVAVARATDTPGNVGYSVGLVRQAELLATHANLAKTSAAGGNLVAAQQHAEHVLNILLGAADPEYGDQDGDGNSVDPGDGYGVLGYQRGLSQTMTALAASPDVTPHMLSRAAEVKVALSNIDRWAGPLRQRTRDLLAATTVEAAQTAANQMAGLAGRILAGEDLDDDGEVEPVTNEGGAVTAHHTSQRSADYLPPAGAVSGQVRHEDASASLGSDRLRLALTGMPPLGAGEGYWAYLVDAQEHLTLLGPIPAASGTTAFVDLAGVNLIERFHGIAVAAGLLYADGELPLPPVMPLRLALVQAGDTPNGKGYAVGLAEQAAILREHAGFAKSSADAGSLTVARLHAEHVLNTLYGESDPRFLDYDDDGVTSTPGDRYGLLHYADSLSQTVTILLGSSGVTANMTQAGHNVHTVLANIGGVSGGGWGPLLDARAKELLAATTGDAARTAAARLVAVAERILNGEDLDDDGLIEPLPNEGGARAGYVAAQSATDLRLTLQFTPGATPTATPTITTTPDQTGAPDGFEDDDACDRARLIPSNGAIQSHNFHDAGDQDWLRFQAKANTTYVIELINDGSRADAVIGIFDACGQDPAGEENNAFGAAVRLEWDAVKNGEYLVRISQFDPAFFGSDTNYRLHVTEDNVPPSPPANLRCLAISQNKVGLQWRQNPERDVVKYRVSFRNEDATDSGNLDVPGAEVTYREVSDLIANELYFLDVVAVDFSNNVSARSGEIPCRAATPTDSTQPALALEQPGSQELITTTAGLLTFSGLATDAGGNLSRVKVRNITGNVEKDDFTLAGASDEFRVPDIPVAIGDNTLQLTVFDEAGNSHQRTVLVRRLGSSAGAVLIVAGHNETFGLQSNIHNAANRAYRIFKSAGYTDDNIFYIAATGQDADSDGDNDVDAAAAPGAVHHAVTMWAAEDGRVGPGKPLFVYLIDHGFAEKYCVSGCGDAGKITPADLDGWLRELETQTGVSEVTVVIEACQSGSFVDRFNGDIANSLAKAGRVIIASTGRTNNAYASAEGAFFSDAFFSCVADSGTLAECFAQGEAAVAATGVDQTPWLDDNGDGAYTAGDGDLAQARRVTRFFSAVRPVITGVSVLRQGSNGLLTANVTAGAEDVSIVWAVVYPPSFQEPAGVTLNLNAPIVRLEADPDQPGRYAFAYQNGFAESGSYRVVFYAQDRLGIHALPVQPGAVRNLYLPLVTK